MGFAFAPYSALIIAMIGAGFIGTLIGSRLLRKIADQRFQLLLSCMLTVLAVGLLAKGTSALIIDLGASDASVARSVTGDQRPEDQTAILQTAAVGVVHPESENHGSADQKDHAGGQGHPTLWEVANRRLQGGLEATQSKLVSVDWRADLLATRTRQDRQRMAALEKEFEAAQEQIHALKSRMSKLEAAGRLPAQRHVPMTNE